MVQHTEKRIVVKVDINSKNSYRFGNGQLLVMFPNTNNLDKRFSAPVNGIVVSAENIPIGAEVLLEHNSCHPTNEIVELKDDNPDIKFYSVPELEVYVWRTSRIDGMAWGNDYYGQSNGSVRLYEVVSDWQPTKYYAIAERVYEPYTGILHGVKPTVIKNTLLIKTGELKDKIVHTVKNGQYEIIYQDTNGQPNQILLTFHVEDEDELSDQILNAKQEIVAIDETLTQRYLKGELYTGLTADNCKPIQTLEYATDDN